MSASGVAPEVPVIEGRQTTATALKARGLRLLSRLRTELRDLGGRAGKGQSLAPLEALGLWEAARADFEKAWCQTGLSSRAAWPNVNAVREAFGRPWIEADARRCAATMLSDIAGPIAEVMRVASGKHRPCDVVWPREQVLVTRALVATAMHVVALERPQTTQAHALSVVLREWVCDGGQTRGAMALAALRSSALPTGPAGQLVVPEHQCIAHGVGLPWALLADMASDIGGDAMRRLTQVASIVGPLRLVELVCRMPDAVVDNMAHGLPTASVAISAGDAHG